MSLPQPKQKEKGQGTKNRSNVFELSNPKWINDNDQTTLCYK